MTSLFISYSRKDIDAARRLTQAFKGQDWDFWIDWEGIPPTVDWWKQIEKGIEQAGVFVFLISPDSARSKVCKQEIEHAIKNGKRLIPLVVRDVSGDEVPSELSHLNWIFYRENDDFNLAFDKLTTAIKTDYDWVQAHRELQVKALEWERSGHENSFLLFGKELQDAEHQLAANTSKEPHPTDLQREYVHKSRQAVDRRRVRNAGITTAGLIALAVLAIFGFVQAGAATYAKATAESNLFVAQTAQADAVHQQALADANAATAVANEKEARRQTSFALSALALSEKDNHFDLSLLLSAAAFDVDQNPTTRGTLLTLGNTNPHLRAYLPVKKPSETSIAFSPDHRIFVSAKDKTFSLWDVGTSKGPFRILTTVMTDNQIYGMAMGQNNTLLALGSANGPIRLWDTSDPNHPSQLANLPDSGYIFEFMDDGNLLLSTEYIYQLLFEPDGSWLLSKSDNSIMVWDIPNTRSPFELARLSMDYGSPVATLAFSPDDKLLAVGSNRVVLWNVQDPHNPTEQKILVESGVADLAFSQDGSVLVAGSNDEILSWNAHTREAIKPPCEIIPGTEIASIALGRYINADILAIGDVTGRISFCNLSGSTIPGLTTSLVGHQDWITSLTFVPGREGLLVSGDQDGAIILWDMRTAQGISSPLRAAGNSAVTSVASDLKGQILTARTMDNMVFLWNISDPGQPEMLSSYLASEDFINQDREKLDINSNKIMASGGLGDRITIWDTSNPFNPRFLATLEGHNDGSDSEQVAFSHQGNILATGYNNGTVILWDMDPSSWLHMICQRAGRNFTHQEWERYFPDETYRKTCDQWPLETEAIATPSPMP